MQTKINTVKKVSFAGFCFSLLMVLSSYTFPESKIAHKYLDGLRGLEIGASAHNPFGLKTLNVDYEDNPISIYKQEEIRICGTYAKVDIVAPGDDLPFKDNTMDFVVNSHVLNCVYDPIKSIEEWFRVIKPHGYIFMIIPHLDRTPSAGQPRTTLGELLERHEHPNSPDGIVYRQFNNWIPEDIAELCHYFGWEIVFLNEKDDKVSNGFICILRK